MNDLIKELEYNKKVNEEKGLDNVINIDYVLARLRNIDIYEEYLKGEIDFNIETIVNDDFSGLSEEEKDKLMHLTDEEYQILFDNICYDDYLNSEINEDIQYELKRLVAKK